ncbi:aminotransferase class V-fold PLP-dependent enzyme [Ornithinimicrobium sp. INDO-MA30-4]|uniref:cysteine desulfurase family protein n=1 Tax=Ornithinimicrobium sp. INDO-MA30-4 TaxID=2908651 RepID=UPI002882E660|nr:aminotransferase class V-fold PLP-dependent enzyme [Ornithinimicrobium sp. INDO-MA30-4]
MSRSYLDHAATSPVLPEVIEVMSAQMMRVGNASSLHTAGRSARRVVEESRESIADDLGIRPSEVIFTSGGTESDNAAIKGTLWKALQSDPRRRRLLVSSIEHHAVLDAVEYLVTSGQADITWLEPDPEGVIQPSELQAALEGRAAEVALISVMWANNEVGTIQPVAELASIAREAGIPFHTDAVQALGQVDLGLTQVRPDLVTMTGHKIGGPLGIGLLIAARDQSPVPLHMVAARSDRFAQAPLTSPGSLVWRRPCGMSPNDKRLTLKNWRSYATL